MAKRKERVKVAEVKPKGTKRNFLSIGFANFVDRADMQVY